MQKGFTLIELLVVVLIIGILAAVALPQYRRSVERSRAADAMIGIRAIRTAEKAYYMQTGAYTNNWDDLDIDFTPQRANNYFNYRLDTLLPTYPNAQAFTKKEGGQNGWGVIWYINPDRMYCISNKTNSDGNNICGAVGAAPVTCVDPMYNCYEIR